MDSEDVSVAAHVGQQSHRYFVHFPPHPAREDDPHYADFNHYHKTTRTAARCHVGDRVGFGDCRDAEGQPCTVDARGEMSGLELHHAHIEFSLQNGVDLTALEIDYPGISDPTAVGAWIETAVNLRWLCAYHHRGSGSAHVAAHADWEAGQYVRGLITESAAPVTQVTITAPPGSTVVVQTPEASE